jgi:hypothetical protein
VIWAKTGNFRHLYQKRYFLVDFLLIQNQPECHTKKNIRTKHLSWPPNGREGHEKIWIFDDFQGFSRIELRFSFLTFPSFKI